MSFMVSQVARRVGVQELAGQVRSGAMFGVALAGAGHYNPPPVFQRLETAVGGFSKHWKKRALVFPGPGKFSESFSKPWKTKTGATP
ncbi:MAG: hypothetical protein NTY53_12715 [Kiritimatiellaeota bacterium]|nr:hypothetical protein [Kiritimatiellota bacterium]